MTIKKFFLFVITVIVFFGVLKGPIYSGMPEKAKPPRITKAELEFPGGGKAWYVTNKDTGCIDYFYYIDEKKEIKRIKEKTPTWLVEGKKTFDFGSFTDYQCRQGVIAINSCPIEYWGWANGIYSCLGAWDWAHGKWYSTCSGYTPCP